MHLHRIRKIAICLLLFVAMFGCAAQEGQQQSGDLSSADADSHEADSVPEIHLAGLDIYTKKCALCHDHGESGSPRLGNPRQWTKRAEQGEATLTRHAIEGFEGKWGEMPPQGDDLSPEEVGSAVKYMLYRYEEAAKTNK